MGFRKKDIPLTSQGDDFVLERAISFVFYARLLKEDASPLTFARLAFTTLKSLASADHIRNCVKSSSDGDPKLIKGIWKVHREPSRLQCCAGCCSSASFMNVKHAQRRHLAITTGTSASFFICFLSQDCGDIIDYGRPLQYVKKHDGTRFEWRRCGSRGKDVVCLVKRQILLFMCGCLHGHNWQ